MTKWMKYGDKSWAEKDYYGASKYYKEALLTDSTNLEILNKYASALRMYNDYLLAEKYYDYLFKSDKNKIYKESLFWLASMQKSNAKYQDARKNFIRFSTYYKDKNTFIYKKTMQEIKSCAYAQELMKDTVMVNVKNLGAPVNTVNADFAALQLNDSSLYFSSLRQTDVVVEKTKKTTDYIVQIFSINKKDSIWLMDSLKKFVSDSLAQNANGTFNSTKTKFYFTHCIPESPCKIWVTEWNGKSWTAPSILPAPINQEGYTSTQPHIAKIDKVEILFFVSDFPSGKGKLDIWQSEMNGNIFSNIKNLGDSINSIDDELSPYYIADAKKLCFASAWHLGLGGFDIFQSTKKETGWATPTNMGYPINTSANDFYYSTFAPTNTAYLTSNRVGSITVKSATCCNDIWKYQLLEKQTTNAVPLAAADSSFKELEKYIPVTLYFHNDEPLPKSLDTTTQLTYEQTIQDYRKQFPIYKMEFVKGLKGEEKNKATVALDEFLNKEVENGFQHLQQFARQLLKNLNKGQRIELTVKGFASPLAKTDYNVHLTLRRIASMENYLKTFEKGVMLPYLSDAATNGGSLSIVKIPFGEYKAQNHVIDDFENTQQSIYSPAAARERRIEVVNVSLSHKDSLLPDIQFVKEIHNFGSVLQGDTLQYEFVCKNTGKKPLMIQSIDAPKEIIKYTFEENAILPNKKATIKVWVNTNQLLGKQYLHLQIHTNARKNSKELTLTMDVLERNK